MSVYVTRALVWEVTKTPMAPLKELKASVAEKRGSVFLVITLNVVFGVESEKPGGDGIMLRAYFSAAGLGRQRVKCIQQSTQKSRRTTCYSLAREL